MTLVKVRTIAPHFNPIGAVFDKVPGGEGSEYECPADTARSLVRDGLVKMLNEESGDGLQVRGGDGTGSGVDGVGGGDGQGGIKASTKKGG